MKHCMEPCIPLPLKPDVLKDLVQKAKDWALMNGNEIIKSTFNVLNIL